MIGPLAQGGCHCGAVRYGITGEPLFSAFCHCPTCRRMSAAPVMAWVMFREDQVTFLKGSPTIHESSPGVRRGFCSCCGTQLSYQADFIPGLIDLTIGSLDEPERVPPQFHSWNSTRLSWLHIDDGLTRHAEFPPLA